MTADTPLLHAPARLRMGLGTTDEPMKNAIIIQSNGFRGDTVSIERHGSEGLLIGSYSNLYRLQPTERRTLPENYVICDVYNTQPYPGDDGRVLWQVAVSADDLRSITA